MAYNVLVVEDEEEIAQIIKEFLENAGYVVDTAFDGLEGYEKFKTNNYDILILDVMMPKIDGFVLCEMIRKESDVPIIMLTALDGEKEQVRGFDLQIDDYITKPFSTILLLKRVENVLRRRGQKSEETYLEYKDIKINLEKFQVFLEGKLLDLTIKEYQLLVLLVQNKGKIFKREDLLKKLWNYEYYGDGRVVDTHIKNLRKKLDRDYIQTVRGVGYGII